jgi:hypothetical protein
MWFFGVGRLVCLFYLVCVCVCVCAFVGTDDLARLSAVYGHIHSASVMNNRATEKAEPERVAQAKAAELAEHKRQETRVADEKVAFEDIFVKSTWKW